MAGVWYGIHTSLNLDIIGADELDHLLTLGGRHGAGCVEVDGGCLLEGVVGRRWKVGAMLEVGGGCGVDEEEGRGNWLRLCIVCLEDAWTGSL